jgi:hypothetical protein
MNRSELHPLEVAILLAVLTIEAAVLLLRAALVPLVALVLVLLEPSRRAAAPAAAAEPPPAAAAAAPHHHPIATLATELQLLPVTQLRAMTGTRSKSIRKAQLIEQVIACS